jgi:hypothetical protein
VPEHAAHGEAQAAAPEDGTGADPDVGGVLAALGAVVRDGLTLAALEARRAGVGLAVMVALGVAAGLLLVTVWLLLAAAAVLGLDRVGVPASLALLAVAALNLAGAGLLAFVVVRLSRRLLFSATRRQLGGGERGGSAHVGETDR